jgi:hypothetical protein
MLPKGLYTALPWLYIALGVVVTLKLESDIKYLPAAALVLAGLLVLAYRHFRGASRRAAVSARRQRPHLHSH